MMAFLEYVPNEVFVFLLVFYLTYILHRHLPDLLKVENSGPPPIPPTVRSFPLIGSALCLPHFQDLHKWFLDESDRLGYVIGFYAGRRLAVVLQSRPLVEEAFLKNAEEFAGRPCTYVRKLCNPSALGFMDHPYNSEYGRYRSLCLNVLEDGGLGKGVIENHIRLVTLDAIEKINQQNGEPFDPHSLITGSITSLLWSILFGRRVDYDDAWMPEVISSTLEYCDRKQSGAVIDIFPLLQFSRKLQREVSPVTEAQSRLLDHLNKAVDECIADRQNMSLVSRYCDAEGVGFDHRELVYLLRDLVSTGVEMISATLRWAILLVANHAEVQRRCQCQIDSVVSRDRLPSAEYRANLPYLDATVLEVMRCKTVLPMSMPRETVCDAYLGGHCIPSGTLVCANLYALHMDPVVWMEPTEFIPERFLTGAGELIRTEKIVPFSIGARACIAETFSCQFICFFLAGLLQRFDVRPRVGQDEIDSREDFRGGVITPFPYHVRLMPRQH